MLNSQVCDTQVAAEEREDRETRCYNEQVHVLAVDDCRIDLKIIEKLLKRFSFKVTAVESAEKALEMLGLGLSDEPNACNGFKVNLIITDYCMPGMSGYDLLKKVKEARALQDIPVVIISSEHIPQRITTCLEEGAEDFIMKPVKDADIVRLNGRLKEPRKSGAGTRSSSNEDASTNCNHDDKDHDQGSGTVAVGTGRKRKAISSSGGSSNKKSSSFASVVFQNQREGLSIISKVGGSFTGKRECSLSDWYRHQKFSMGDYCILMDQGSQFLIPSLASSRHSHAKTNFLRIPDWILWPNPNPDDTGHGAVAFASERL